MNTVIKQSVDVYGLCVSEFWIFNVVIINQEIIIVHDFAKFHNPSIRLMTQNHHLATKNRSIENQSHKCKSKAGFAQRVVGCSFVKFAIVYQMCAFMCVEVCMCDVCWYMFLLAALGEFRVLRMVIVYVIGWIGGFSNALIILCESSVMFRRSTGKMLKSRWPWCVIRTYVHICIHVPYLVHSYINGFALHCVVLNSIDE